MRLIKKQNVADSITRYYAAVKNTDFRKQLITNNETKISQTFQNVFDNSYFRTKLINDSTSIAWATDDYKGVKMFVTDILTLKKYAAFVSMQESYDMVYLLELKDLRHNATRLLSSGHWKQHGCFV